MSSDVIVHSYLTTSILVRYIKIVPVTYTNAVAMRIELSGCVNSEYHPSPQIKKKLFYMERFAVTPCNDYL